MQIICAQCSDTAEKPDAEIKRQMKNGRRHFFCSISCSVIFNNAKRANAKKDVIKTCPVCMSEFQTKTGAKSPTFCSHSCASRGGVTEFQRETARKIGAKNLQHGNIYNTAAGLRKREAPKYEQVRSFLNERSIPHQFEYPIENAVGRGIFDLALPDRRLLIEFDGQYHESVSQYPRDAEKDLIAQTDGWQIERVAVDAGVVIDYDSIKHLLTT